MKLLLILFTLLGLATTPLWQTNMEQARAEAKADHKLVLLYFSGSDWCGPCIKLKKDVYESDAFAAYAAQRLVLVRADFPRAKKNQLSPEQTAHNERLAERYNPDGQFPLSVLLDADGKVLRSWAGYPASLTAQSLTHDIDAAAAH